MATDQEMLARIAELNREIQKKKSVLNQQQATYSSAYATRGAIGGSSGSFRRGTGYRGRGSMHLSLSNNQQVHTTVNSPSLISQFPDHSSTRPLSDTPSHSPTPRLTSKASMPSASYNKTLVLNSPKTASVTTINNSLPAPPSIGCAATSSKANIVSARDGYIVKGGKLIRKELLNRSPLPASLTGRANRRFSKSKVLQGPLVRKASPNKVLTRQPEGYVRQGRAGQSLVLNTRKATNAQPTSRYCGFYTRFGRCPNANHCPFVHDPKRKAICPMFLSGRCKKPPHLCKLSHQPNPNIMPHCVYLQKGSCTNDNCPFIHVKVNPKAPVCRPFAMEGYCSKGLDCTEKHVHVCPEFADTGKCSNANCRLPHVAKRDRNSSAGHAAGVVRLGTWVSTEYFYAQRKAQREKREARKEKQQVERTAKREALTAKFTWTNPAVEEKKKVQQREKEEAEGFVRLLDDSEDDDGWSQYERNNSDDEDLTFNELEVDDDGEADACLKTEMELSNLAGKEFESNDKAIMTASRNTMKSLNFVKNTEGGEQGAIVKEEDGGHSVKEEFVDAEGDTVMTNSPQSWETRFEQSSYSITASVDDRDKVAAEQVVKEEFFDALDQFAVE